MICKHCGRELIIVHADDLLAVCYDNFKLKIAEPEEEAGRPGDGKQ